MTTFCCRDLLPDFHFFLQKSESQVMESNLKIICKEVPFNPSLYEQRVSSPPFRIAVIFQRKASTRLKDKA
jgi:hypothetical protein